MDLLTEAHAEQFYLSFITSSDTAREQMREVFAVTDTRLPPLERARLGTSGSVFASPKVRGLYLVHLHFHGGSAEDVAAIVGRVNRERR